MAAFSTIALLSLAGATTAMSAVSSIKAGNAAARGGEAQRRVANAEAELQEYNANVADLQAADALERGREEEGKFRQSVKQMIGGTRASQGASGTDVNFGSNVDTQADMEMLGELDALTIRTNAGREAWGYQVQATDLRKRAEIARKEGVALEEAGRQAKGASRWEAVGTIAGGASSVLQARYGFGRRS